MQRKALGGVAGETLPCPILSYPFLSFSTSNNLPESPPFRGPRNGMRKRKRKRGDHPRLDNVELTYPSGYIDTWIRR